MALSRVKVWGAERLYAADLNAEFNNIILNASSLISPLSGSLDWDGYAHTLDAAGVTTVQSTSAIAWSFTPGSKSGTPSTTGGVSNWAANTYTDSATAGSGTATAWTAHSFQRPTLASSNASVTTTDAATVYIANAPAAGSNETLTNPWALWIDAGNVRVDDNVTWLSGTAFKGTIDHANSADRTYTFPDATGTIPYIAAQSDVNAMTSTATALTPNHNKLVLGTEAASTSGTTVDFTGIPSGVRRISITFEDVSTNGTSNYIVQIGDSGGVETTGYTSTAVLNQGTGNNVGSSSTGFAITGAISAAANVINGTVTLTLKDSTNFTWACEGIVICSNTSGTNPSAGVKSLSAELDRVRITTTSADTFDAGSINIVYER